jgi:hypothetical protein
MSQYHAGTVSSPEVEQETEEQKLETRAVDLEHEAKTTDLARISEITTGLRFAECEQDVEDELLEASLEQYQ